MKKSHMIVAAYALGIYLLVKWSQSNAAPANPAGAGYSTFVGSDGKTYFTPNNENVIIPHGATGSF